MGTAAKTTNVAEILKNIWQDEIHDFLYEDCTLFGLMPKDTTWDGLLQIITVMYGGMNGRSALFANAQTNKAPPKYKQMQVPARDNFVLWSVDHKLITLSRNQRGALVRALAENTERALTRLKRSVSEQIWRNGGGAIGFILSLPAADTIQLQDINNVRNFEVGDIIGAAVDDGYTGSAGQKGTTLSVLAVDEDLGRVQMSAGIVASGWALNDSLFHDGDYNAVFHGVSAYVTLNAPGVSNTPTTIHGMDRTAHKTRLAGHRFTAATSNVSDEIKAVLAKVQRRNCDVTHLFAPPEAFDEVESELQTQKRYVDEKIGRVGYTGLEFTMQGGKILKLFADSDLPKSANSKRQIFGLSMPTWKFHTATSFPMWLTLNGQKDFMMEQSANQSEGRNGGYGNVYTTAPGENFVLELTS